MSGKYYAVRIGRHTGVYRTWAECKSQVHGFSGAVFKSFKSFGEAQHFISDKSYKPPSRIAGFKRTSSYHVSADKDSSVKRYKLDETVPIVYSDGSCHKNGQKGACGGVGVFWSDGHTHNVSEKLLGVQTNQRAELVSACRALESAISQSYKSIEVRTDSSYTIKAMTEWIYKWERNHWKTTTGEPVKNQSDIKRLHDLCKQITVKWTHVPGHHGIYGNEMADRLAKAGAQKTDKKFV